MPLFHIPQYIIQNRNVHISVLNDALRDVEQGHSGICEIALLGGLSRQAGFYDTENKQDFVKHAPDPPGSLNMTIFLAVITCLHDAILLSRYRAWCISTVHNVWSRWIHQHKPMLNNRMECFLSHCHWVISMWSIDGEVLPLPRRLIFRKRIQNI